MNHDSPTAALLTQQFTYSVPQIHLRMMSKQRIDHQDITSMGSFHQRWIYNLQSQ